MSGAKYKNGVVALRGFDGRTSTKPPTLLRNAGWGTHLGFFGGGCRQMSRRTVLEGGIVVGWRACFRAFVFGVESDFACEL